MGKIEEALKTLEVLEETISPLLEPVLTEYEDVLSDIITANYFVLKQALLKAQEIEKENKSLKADLTIELKNKKNAVEMFKEQWVLREKQGKALEVIKKKCMGNDNIYLVYISKNYELYKSAAELGIRNITQVSLNEDELLTEAEFETLKEGLK